MQTPYIVSRRPYALRGRYQHTVRSGALTTVAAFTSTAGHLFSWRWDDATVSGLIGFVRYVGIKFELTTAFGTDQVLAFGLRRASSYSASHSGGTAVDVGGTVTGSGKRYYAQPASLLTSCRIGSTDALTAGTHTLDANPINVLSFFAETVGDEFPSWESGLGMNNNGLATLWDSRASGDHLEFDNDEGFIISNEILMGATGVGTLQVCVEWDEGILSGAQ
jgi:hypothetical protein